MWWIQPEICSATLRLVIWVDFAPNQISHLHVSFIHVTKRSSNFFSFLILIKVDWNWLKMATLSLLLNSSVTFSFMILTDTKLTQQNINGLVLATWLISFFPFLHKYLAFYWRTSYHPVIIITLNTNWPKITNSS